MECDQCGREGPGEYATRSDEIILCVSCIGGFFRFRTMAILVGVSLFLMLGGIALIGFEGRPGLQFPICISGGIVAIAMVIYALPLARIHRIGNTPFFAKRVAPRFRADAAPLELAESRKSPPDRRGLFEAALAAESTGSLDAAARMYAQVIASEPSHVMAHVGLAAILNVRGQHDNAAVLCRRALELDPNSGKAHGVMGAIHFSQNESMLAMMEWMRGAELGDASSADMLRRITGR